MIEVYLIPNDGECPAPVQFDAEHFCAREDGVLTFWNVTKPATFFGAEETATVATFAAGEWRYFRVVEDGEDDA